MMYPLFPGNRISPMMVKPGTYSFLYGFHYFLILHFHCVQTGTCAFVKQFFFPYISQKGNLVLIYRNRLNDIYTESPRIEIKHHIGENEEIVSGHFLSIIRGGSRKFKYFFIRFCQAKLQI